VESGLDAFNSKRDYDEAVRLFKAAMQLQPSSEEAAAALYNLACAYAKQRKFKEACQALQEAVDDHNLKISVAINVSRTPVEATGHTQPDASLQQGPPHNHSHLWPPPTVACS
jgi:tetratricopeptide (TPR) repeat protein